MARTPKKIAAGRTNKPNVETPVAERRAKILCLDIETAPLLAHVWSLWKQNVGAKQLIQDSYVMCVAAKWLGSPDMMYAEARTLRSEKAMLLQVRSWITEADFLIGHNAKSFDLPKLNAAMLRNGIAPPARPRVIDTLLIAKKEFRFTSNRLDSLAVALGCAPKSSHAQFPGHELWAETLKGNPAAWAEMQAYCKQDVLVTEEVYRKLRPWDTTHPNINVMRDTTDEHGEEAMHCPHCGSTHLNKNGKRYTNTGEYTRYRCMDCGASSRSRYTENTLKKRKSLLTAT